MKKLSILASLLLIVGVIAGGSIAAADDDTSLPYFTDGRMNAYDIAAPVVIYCINEDVSEGAMQSIDLYAQRYSDGAWEAVLSVPAADILEAMEVERDEAVELGNEYGYAVWLNTDDSVTVVAPADASGNVYSYTWNLDDPGC
jgi:hypothetical protein